MSTVQSQPVSSVQTLQEAFDMLFDAIGYAPGPNHRDNGTLSAPTCLLSQPRSL